MCTGAELAVAASLAGTAVSAVGAVQQGKAAKASADYNAAVAHNQAIAARQKAEFDAERERERVQRLLGAQRAGFAKGGVEIEGTPLLVMEDAAEQGELDVQAILYGGDIQSDNYQAEAGLRRMEGAQAKKAGMFGAGSTLLTGASSTYLAGKEAGVF